MMEFCVAFTAKADKIFRIMGYNWHQEQSNFFYMVCVKSSFICFFRDTTLFAMASSMLSSNITSYSPFAVIVRTLATAPIRAVLSLHRFIMTRATKTGMSSYQVSTNPAWFLLFFLITCISWTIFFLASFNLCTIVLSDRTPFTPYGIIVAEFATVGAWVHMFSYPLLFITHSYILPSRNQNIKPHSPRQNV